MSTLCGRVPAIILLSVSLLLPVLASGETRQEKGRRLVETARDIIGGEAFLAMKNMVQTGRAYSFYEQRLRGLARMTIYNHYEPDERSEDPEWLPVSRREVYTEKGDYYTLFRNGQGWEVTYLGARMLTEDRLHRYREAARRDIFYVMRYRMDEPGMYYFYAGTEIIDNVPADTVEITDVNGDGITVYFRQSDHLPIQQVYIRRDKKTRIPYQEMSMYSKYRKVGPLTLPWNIRRERDGTKTFELFGRSVKVNQSLSPNTFSLSEKLEILPPAP